MSWVFPLLTDFGGLLSEVLIIWLTVQGYTITTVVCTIRSLLKGYTTTTVVETAWFTVEGYTTASAGRSVVEGYIAATTCHTLSTDAEPGSG